MATESECVENVELPVEDIPEEKEKKRQYLDISEITNERNQAKEARKRILDFNALWLCNYIETRYNSN